MKPIELIPFLNTLTDQAGKLLISFFEGSFRVDSKDSELEGIDIVTDADRASEQYIMESISSNFPGHDILTEETVTYSTGSEWLWIVDPLDGTVNFAHGFPHFCVSVAIAHKDELVAGMVYDPLKGERFWAVRGGGSFLNGRNIRVSTAGSLNKSLVATGFPYDKARSKENNILEFSRVVVKVQGIRRPGSAALDLVYVASGRFDGFWELKLKPWDQAAGMLIVEEAGGKVTDRCGAEADFRCTNIVATNGLIHEELLEVLAH